MVADLFKVLIYCGVLAGVIYVGWDNPLRYRFMSPTAVATEQRIAREGTEAGSQESTQQWRPMGTALDRAPYEVVNGRVKYSSNFDPRKTGSPTEVDYRKGTRRAAGVEH